MCLSGEDIPDELLDLVRCGSNASCQQQPGQLSSVDSTKIDSEIDKSISKISGKITGV